MTKENVYVTIYIIKRILRLLQKLHAEERIHFIMKILIQKGRILNPSDQRDEVGDIYMEDGVIQEIGGTITPEETPDKVILQKAVMSCRD